jgi:hypothetical protein
MEEEMRRLQGGEMNRDDIIRMAREAGIPIETDWAGRPSTMVIKDGGTYLRGVDDLERFAALVAAAERKRIESRPWGAGKEWIARAVEAEREACAKLCELYENDMGYGQPQQCANAIRARGER